MSKFSYTSPNTRLQLDFVLIAMVARIPIKMHLDLFHLWVCSSEFKSKLYVQCSAMILFSSVMNRRT